MAFDYPTYEDHQAKNIQNAKNFDIKQFHNVDREWFRSLLGETWVAKREKKLEATEKILYPVHGLLEHSYFWVDKVKVELQANPDELIIALCSLIRHLQRIQGIKGFEKKVELLKVQDQDSFNSVVWEIACASAFVFDETNVEFIEESEKDGIRSPDIHVDAPKGSFQIECKCKEIKDIYQIADITKYVKRIMKDASQQLEGDLPGQLWCQLPLENDLSKAYSIMARVKTDIESSLRSTDSRNVNRVCVVLPTIHKIESGEKKGMGKSLVREVMFHPNPRIPFDWS